MAIRAPVTLGAGAGGLVDLIDTGAAVEAHRGVAKRDAVLAEGAIVPLLAEAGEAVEAVEAGGAIHARVGDALVDHILTVGAHTASGTRGAIGTAEARGAGAGEGGVGATRADTAVPAGEGGAGLAGGELGVIRVGRAPGDVANKRAEVVGAGEGDDLEGGERQGGGDGACELVVVEGEGGE